MVLSFGVVFWFYLQGRYAQSQSPARAVMYAQFLLVAVFLAFYFWPALRLMEVWSEEYQWLNIGKQILAGDRVHPIAAKTDYPSSYQAFAIAFLLKIGFSPLTASRVAGLLLYLGALFFFWQIMLLMSYRKDAALASLVFPALSVSAISAFLVGWHEITHVNLLILGSWYYFLNLTCLGRTQSLIPLGILISLSIWTLYTPALFAGILVLLLIFSPSSLLSFKQKATLALVVSILCAPVLGQLVQTNGRSIMRVYQFYIEGGEWSNTKFSPDKRPVNAYEQTMQRMAEHLSPSKAAGSVDELVALHPEITTLFFSVLGLVWLGFRWRRRAVVGLYLPGILLLVGVVLSNPTVWRESCLNAVVFLLAGIGFCQLVEWSYRRYGRFFCAGLVLLILIGHVYLFIPKYHQARMILPSLSPMGRLAETLYSEIMRRLVENDQIVLTDDLTARVLASLFPRGVRPRFCLDADKCVSETSCEENIVVFTSPPKPAQSLGEILRQIEAVGAERSIQVFYGSEGEPEALLIMAR